MTQDYRNTGVIVSMQATGTTRKNRFVAVSGNHTVIESDSGSRDIGVALEAATASGDEIQVQLRGIVKVEAGGTLTAGIFVNSDNDGKAVEEATTNNLISGVTLDAADSGDYCTVLLMTPSSYLSSS